MEALSSSEMLVHMYQTALHSIPEESHLHARQHKNFFTVLLSFVSSSPPPPPEYIVILTCCISVYNYHQCVCLYTAILVHM